MLPHSDASGFCTTIIEIVVQIDMTIVRYPAQLQAIYSELLSRLQQAAIEGIAASEGSFSTKTQGDRRYWYFRRRVGERIVERYLGAESPALLERIEALRHDAADAKAAARGRRDLVRLLKAGGYAGPDARTGRLLAALAAAGTFRLRAVLVGTHAFRCYGAMLGVRLPAEAALTQDIDLAQFSTVSVAVGDRIEPGFAAVLSEVERFVAVPSLRSRAASSTWRTADRALEVELLTPMVGPERSSLVTLPALQAQAQPLRFLDYLIHQTTVAAIPHGAGVLVDIPLPERYACHKLIVAQRRSGAGQRDKSAKDVAQAAALLDVLLTDHPDDLVEAWTDLRRRGSKWREAADAGLRRLPSDLRAGLADLVGR